MYVMCLSQGLDAIARWKEEFRPTGPVAFIPNAGDTYRDPYFVRESKRRIEELLNLTTKVLDLRQIGSSSQFEDAIGACSAVFVAGGNSFNLLHELRRSESFLALRNMVLTGFPYFGESAGAVILYKTIAPVAMIDDPQAVPDLASTDALDIVDFITLPHINREKHRTLFESFCSKYGAEHRIIKIRDDEAILTRDGSTIEVLPSGIGTLA